jgi:hypothetical protein
MTMTTRLQLIIALAAAWSGSLAQTAAPIPARSGDNSQLNNIAIIQQAGLGNETNLLQKGFLNSATNLQQGNYNQISLTQFHAGGATGNTSSVVQVGDFGTATLSQSTPNAGTQGNTLTLAQYSNATSDSEKNQAQLTMDGSANTVAIEQGTSANRVKGNSAAVSTTGNTSQVQLSQYSNNNTTSVEQSSGDGNLVLARQNSPTANGENNLTVRQTGSNNTVRGMNVGEPGLQYGTGNTAIITQGGGMTLQLQQIGNNNFANGTVGNYVINN